MFTHLFRKGEEPAIRCKQRPLFNESDLLFFSYLQKILPTRLIFPQLHLSAILISKPAANQKNQAYIENTLDNLVIDFGIFNSKLELLCAIELEQKDESSTQSPAQSISQCLHEANVSHIKWNKNQLPSFEQMERLLAPFIEDYPRKLAEQNLAKERQLKEAALRKEVEEIENNTAISHSEQIDPIEDSFCVDISHYDIEKRIEIEKTKDKTGEATPKESVDYYSPNDNFRRAPIIPIVDLTIINEHDNPNALSLRFLRDLTPHNFIQKEYPHIWHRICLFAEDPPRLNNYLDSLFVQDRPVKRAGLPLHVANEVILIKIENKHKVQDVNDEDIWISGASASTSRQSL